MNEIEAMIQKAQRYIQSAKLLIDNGDCDSAVSIWLNRNA